MLKPEIKQKWLEALRSNQYPQGKEALRRVETMSTESSEMELKINCFCCLGVLCDISEQGQWTQLHNEYYYSDGVDKGDDFPPLAVTNSVLAVEVDDVSQEAIHVCELEDSEEFAAAVHKWNPDRKVENIIKHERVFEALASMNDKGATFLEIADVIEKYL